MIAAAAGMAVPALVYLAGHRLRPGPARGWAIPAATDIAFAIGVLALLGTARAALAQAAAVTIAIVDDIGAVRSSRCLYTAELNLTALAVGAAADRR